MPRRRSRRSRIRTYLVRQRTLNRDARAFTRKAFEAAGYKVLPSEGNFVMVDVRRESSVYQQLCREAGVAIARPFPPLTTYARITIGTMDEMRKALPLMIPLLAAPARTTSPGVIWWRAASVTRRSVLDDVQLLIGAAP